MVKTKSGLSELIIGKIDDVFGSFDEIEEAILFGSRAKGNYKEGSDIDIAIKGRKLNLAILRKIELKLDDLEFPYVIDLIIYHQIEEPLLLEHINRAGVCIYKK